MNKDKETWSAVCNGIFISSYRCGNVFSDYLHGVGLKLGLESGPIYRHCGSLGMPAALGRTAPNP
ncbi:hypothetical protein F4824DRAFT_461845 [Ustulina deusta]|nr:hypothetical protein F4824DRAFT_461845 [Ustulina deusta]